jgi:biotin transport system substrate-specific component
MSDTPSVAPPVADLLWPAGDGLSRALRDVALALVGSLMLWASAEASLPFYPVPMTLQTAVVFVLGMAYGPQLGATTVLLYLLEGALGLPVFAGTPERGIGMLYMVGPTGGYLLGFIAAAAITGWVTARRAHWSEITGGLLIATAVIYLLGAGWLGLHIGWKAAMTLGVRPFLLGDLLKIVMVTALAETGLAAVQKRLREA